MLRKKLEATNFIQDFLNIIANHMLVIEKEDRATVGQLMPMFNAIKAECARNVSYYTSPSTSTGSAAVAQIPAAQTLSIQAQELIRKASRAIPRYTGQTEVGLQRTAATHLKP